MLKSAINFRTNLYIYIYIFYVRFKQNVHLVPLSMENAWNFLVSRAWNLCTWDSLCFYECFSQWSRFLVVFYNQNFYSTPHSPSILWLGVIPNGSNILIHCPFPCPVILQICFSRIDFAKFEGSKRSSFNKKKKKRHGNELEKKPKTTREPSF